MHNLAEFTDRITATGFQYDSADNLIAASPTGTSCTYEPNITSLRSGQTYLDDGDGVENSLPPNHLLNK